MPLRPAGFYAARGIEVVTNARIATDTLTAGDDPTEYGVTVTVTAVDGGDAEFDVEVDGEPQG